MEFKKRYRTWKVISKLVTRKEFKSQNQDWKIIVYIRIWTGNIPGFEITNIFWSSLLRVQFFVCFEIHFSFPVSHSETHTISRNFEKMSISFYSLTSGSKTQRSLVKPLTISLLFQLCTTYAVLCNPWTMLCSLFILFLLC